MSKLLEKAKAFQSVKEPLRAPERDPDRPRTGVGAFTASLAMGRQIEEQNRLLKAKVDELSAASVVQRIDPRLIHPSAYANRSEASFATAEFESFKAEISSAGGNIEPVKLRPLRGAESAEYEIVFGHRRVRACRELGLSVTAIVEEIDDATLFAEMDRENRGRANLSAWERGVMYKRALDTKLFGSLRSLAETVGADPGDVSRAIKLASLPDEVVAAFPSPLDLQYHWGSALSHAVSTDPRKVLLLCRSITQLRPRPPAKRVFDLICGMGQQPDQKFSELYQINGKRCGDFERSPNGDLRLRIKAGAFDESDEKALRDLVSAVFARKNSDA